jgi:ADP-heptose:LPS heptosyltransferase
MSLLSKINVAKRFVTKLFTSQLSNKGSFETLQIISPNQIKRVLISRPNHRLGNQLLTTSLIQEVSSYFPDSKIDLFVKGGVAYPIFENYSQIGNIIALPKNHFSDLGKYLLVWLKLRTVKYDLAINVEQGSSSGRLSIKIAKAKLKFYGDLVERDLLISQFPEAKHNAKFSVYIFRAYLQKLGIKTSKQSIFPIDLRLTESEVAQGKIDLKNLEINHKKPTISLFTYATGSKCYDKTWWKNSYEALYNQFGKDFNFIEVLPVENVSQLDFAIPNYYSKEIRAIAGLIANTAIFIGADSGMMHLASASQTTTVGLFSVTDIQKYQPFANGSIAIKTEEQSLNDMVLAIKTVLQNSFKDSKSV